LRWVQQQNPTVTATDSIRLARRFRDLLLTTDTVPTRPISEARLNELRQDPAFQYGPRVDIERSLWERFWEWLARQLAPEPGDEMDLDNLEVGKERANYTVLIVLAVVLLLLILTRFNLREIFYRKGAKSNLQFTEHEEDIHTENLPNLLAEALAAKDFRRAIRLRFLALLKRLSDDSAVAWSPEKTNFDYAYELRPEAARKHFREAVKLYEFPWYGKYEAQRTHYDRLNFLAGEVERMAERNPSPSPVSPPSLQQ
jgi:hypothetical protein